VEKLETPSTRTTLPLAVRNRSAFSARYSSESYQRRACSMLGNSVTTMRLGFQSSEPTPDDLREIDSAASRITVQGARYPERLQQMTGL
jgi:hypothetical protein